MKKKSFVRDFSLLALSVIVAKIIGAMYRIPLANILGAEGIGRYQLIFPVFSLMLTLCSGGIPVAVSILVSGKKAKGEETKEILSGSLCAIGAFGLVLTVVMLAVARPISALQSNPDGYLGYIVIAPSIVVSALIAVFRGYYMGHNNMIPSGISQVLESGVKLLVGLTLAVVFIKKSLAAAVLGALLGVTAAELVTLLVMVIYAAAKGDFTKIERSGTASMKELFSVSVPLTLSGVILPLSQFADSLLMVNLIKSRYGTALATANYGLLSGTVSPLINLPVMLTISLGMAVIPGISAGLASRDISSIKTKSDMCIKLAVLVGVPFVLVYLLAGDSLINLFYPTLSDAYSATAATLLRIEAVSVLSLSLNQIFTSLLQALGKAAQAVKILALCVGIKTVLSLILLPVMGIAGGAVASTVAFFINAIITGILLSKNIGVSVGTKKNSSVIALAGVIMGIAVFGFRFLLQGRWMVVGASLISGVVYVASLLAFGVFTKQELESLPLSKIWLKLDRIFRRDDSDVAV